MKSNYDKKQNWLIVVLFALSITLTASLTAKLVKRADNNDNQINEVKQDLLDIESMLAKKEAVVLYDSTENTDENDLYWGTKYIKKTEVEKYEFIYLKYNLFSSSSGNYSPSSVSGDTLLKVETICLNLQNNGSYYNSSVINGMYFANLSVINGSGDNIDCYSFYATTLGINGNSGQNAFISSIVGIY